MKKQFIGLLFLLILVSCNSKLQIGLTKEFIHPGPGYSKAVIVTNGNVKTIYVAGLTGDGNDLEAQTRSAFANIKTELEAAGAAFKDIVKTNTYIVNSNPEKVALFRSIRKETLGEKEMPASTLLGVPVLASPDKLIEIEVIAVFQIIK
jgi:enamine deaminase RidA (YjgF/YER057c/UK114 family)